ncbi:phosphate-starvation-inducible PsiE family protein [Methylobacter sp. BlB1]|uniref:phosphate-starvation-inducible PsiE family protein n=1 Tax=Methylobacter sp. BlB1 TaxID=2785914 RepID=UPI001895D084|nr:phosphate-starvation-inducible PsiE family protein [Methylobacter sp. BlB1]MBF6648217.1 BLUF domain-containing protein [Methylobacter sp. BlB1]
MIRLIFASTALKDWNAEELLGLLKICRTNNSARDITGALIYLHRTFFQILEGDEQAVDETFEKIQKDMRHKDVTQIERKPIAERDFPYWSMGFEKLDEHDLNTFKDFPHFFDKEFTPAGIAAHRGIIDPLVNLLRVKLIKHVSVTKHEELPIDHEDSFIQFLHRTIRTGVKFLAMLMTFVILLGIVDVIYVIYEKMTTPPFLLMTTDEILDTFGAFLAVLIAIEIFLNITLYIRSDVIPVKLVVATALMAVARKVIVFDYKHLPYEYVGATALVVVALGITYWLIQKKE